MITAGTCQHDVLTEILDAHTGPGWTTWACTTCGRITEEHFR